MGRSERYRQQNQVECGLRVVDGTTVGLGPRFRHGLATLGPRPITFVPDLGGVRFLRRSPLNLAVQHLDRSNARSIPFTEQLTARWGATVVIVRTGDATLEWVLPPAESMWAAERVLGWS